MAKILDFQLFKKRRSGVDATPSVLLPWSPDQWPMCRIRYFAENGSAKPPRCCCGHVYNEATLQTRAPIITAIVREEIDKLAQDGGEVTIPRLVEAILAHPELTSVERAALNTSPCASCPVLAQQSQQLHFLWGLYRAYWRRAVASVESRSHHGQLVALEAYQSAGDLRGHIRQEIALIRRLKQQLSLCPWARRRAVYRARVGT